MIGPQDMAAVHRAVFAPEARFGAPWPTSAFEDLIGMRGVEVLGDTRAFALVRQVADEAELLTLATHPDWQRQGLARHLITQWHQKAAANGAIQSVLEVARDNAPARTLYADLGYHQAGTRRDYYTRSDGSRGDALLMICRFERLPGVMPR